MKKAYNVYEKANIPAILRSISLAFVFGVCFLGFQTQTTAQAALPDAVSQVDQSDIKELYKDFNLENISIDAEAAATKLKEFGYSVTATPESTTEGELEQVVTVQFINAINKRLNRGEGVAGAVQGAYTETLSSPFVTSNESFFNAERTLETVIAVLN